MKTLFKNGEIYDGTGGRPYIGDVLIEDDVIVKVGGEIAEEADKVVDLSGYQMFGILLSWEAPDPLPLHYNLYREGMEEVIEIDAEYTSYLEEREPGNYIYRLTAVYDNCESDYALTPTGEDYVTVEVTSVPEVTDEIIVNVTKVYNMRGQAVNCSDLKSLNAGIYILQGVTSTGKLVTRKIMVSPIE